MSHPSRTVLALSAGAALAACPLAAAAVPVLSFSTLESANGSITLGSTTGSLSISGGPYPAGYDSLTVTAGYGAGIGYAWHVPARSLDVFIGRLITVGYHGNGNWTFTVVMNVNQAVRFSDLSFAGLRVATWLMDSAAISDGDLVSIGQHTFTGTVSYTGAAITQLASGFGFYAAAAGVPLPGAAGLAAIGLAGMSRRRRR